MTNDERELIDEKFKSIHGFIIASNDLQAERDKLMFQKLDSIEEQTKKTNGRVTKLEDKVLTLEKADLIHFNNCPHTDKINELDKELEDYRFIKKYPKVFIAGMAVLIIVFALELVSKFI